MYPSQNKSVVVQGLCVLRVLVHHLLQRLQRAINVAVIKQSRSVGYQVVRIGIQ